MCLRKDGFFKNHYPKEFCSSTTQGKNSYPVYKRRYDNEQLKVRCAYLDNQWVIPYNPYLLAKFDCHMNVEIYSTIKAVKYLYKYIYKGYDRVTSHIVGDENYYDVDEIEQFQTGRWISPPEAAWRIYKFSLNEIYPSVRSLQLHLEEKQVVAFKKQDDLLHIVFNDHASRTMMTEFFQMNKINVEAQ